MFQRDAQTRGAEQVIWLTLSRFAEHACESANMTISLVNFIDGDRLVAPIREDGESGGSLQTTRMRVGSTHSTKTALPSPAGPKVLTSRPQLRGYLLVDLLPQRRDFGGELQVVA